MTLLLLLLVSLSPNVHAPPDGPRFSIGTSIVDLGTLPAGRTGMADIVVANIGDLPLSLEVRNVSCSCTGILLRDGSVPPGEHKPLRILLNTDGRSGQVRESICLATNDPLAREVVLEVQATVLSAIRLLPERVWLGTIVPLRSPQVTTSAELRIISRAGGLATPPEVLADSRVVQLRFDNSRQTPGVLSYFASVTPALDQGPGVHWETVRLRFHNGEEKSLRIGWETPYVVRSEPRVLQLEEGRGVFSLLADAFPKDSEQPRIVSVSGAVARYDWTVRERNPNTVDISLKPGSALTSVGADSLLVRGIVAAMPFVIRIPVIESTVE